MSAAPVTGSGSGALVARLLSVAERVLNGEVETPDVHRVRAAAILGRAALEELVRALCAVQGLQVARTTMRVQLACLRAAAPGVAGEVAIAWWGLSRACHQHAYEIAPHHNEVHHLLVRLRRIHEAVPEAREPTN